MMTIKSTSLRFDQLFLALILACTGAACTTQPQQQQMEEGLESDQGVGDQEAASNNLDLGEDYEDDATSLNNNLNAGFDAAENPGIAPAPLDTPANNLAIPMDTSTSMGSGFVDANSGDASQRQVRFVIADGTAVYSRADTAANPVATLFQGDPLVVKLLGDWAEITPDRFVQSSGLSEQVIPRPKLPNAWMAPAAP